MRIAHFMYDNRSNPWLGGGGAMREWEINRRLVAAGHEVHVFCGAVPNSTPDWEDSGIYYHTCGVAKNYVLSRLNYNLSARKRWQLLQQKTPFDLLIEDSSPFTVLPKVRKITIPTVAIIQNFMGQRLVKKMGPIGWWFAAHERSIQKKYKNYITVSQFLKSSVALQQPTANIEVVYNGIDDIAFSTKQSSRIPGQIMFLGRIDAYHKGLDILLSAFDQLTQKKSPVTLKIVGGGKDEGWLKREVASRSTDRISFLGRLGAERFDLLAQSELLIMPSRFEGWGITAIEAAAVGTPVVGTSVDGLKEAIDDGVTGLLVEPNAEALAKGVDALLNNREMRQKMSDAGRIRAKMFNWDTLSSLQEAVYRNAL